MANIGEQLKQPESGMKRIDDTFYAIKYSGHVNIQRNVTGGYYNNNSYTAADNIEFYIYSSKLILTTEFWNNYRISTIDVYIDDEFIETVSQYNSSDIPHAIYFKKVDMEKRVHKIVLKKKESETSSYNIIFDALDIDEDGYMVYKSEDGKLYYDVTPIMTSNTTPSGYEASASSVYPYGNYAPYKAFDGIEGVASTGWASSRGLTTNQWIQLNIKDKTLVNKILYQTVKDGDKEAPKTFDIQGSNDGTSWITLSSYNNITDWSRANNNGFDTKLFDVSCSKYQYYRLYIYEGNGADASAEVISASEIRYLLEVDTPFFLIEDNGAYYNIDDSNSLVQVNDISKLGEPALANECIYDVNKILEVKDSLSANAKIISNKNYNLIKNRIYNKDEMVIANGNIVTRIMAEIQQVLGVYDLDGNCSIKMVVSEDNGATWLTTPDNGSIWDTLDNTVDLSIAYKDMTNEQKTQWNSLMEEIKLKGYDITKLSTIDYSRFNKNVNGIRHAYVISIVDADSVAIAKELKMKFNAFGDYVQMAVGTEVNIRQSDATIVVTPTNDTEDLLVNIGLSSDRAIEGGGSSEEFTYTTSDVDNIINGL